MYLDKISSPADLQKLEIEELPELAQEIRQRIIEIVASHGGHLASSLGVVELTLALHYCLNMPKDKIVWDVGHQSYAHKILTGRNKEFSTLRQYKGLSGFPKPEESIYDVFATGHSGTAISLALGLAMSNPQDKAVAVIGDGSLSNGLCFEGLNNVGQLKCDLLVILNTNELSIAPNAGALSKYLNKIISLPIYNRFRNRVENLLKIRIPRGQRIINMMDKFEEAVKGLFVPGMFFEELGLRYFGPLDGHNLDALISALRNILMLPGPRILHLVTVKGKGYAPAEKEPVKFHSASPFDITTGRINKKNNGLKPYTEVFGEALVKLAKADPKIVAITAAMPEGTGLDRFRDAFPDRFFDVGIAESHALCFASGLARGGLKPVVVIYSTFLQRAYDQIILDVALQNSALVLAIDRAGIVGADGPTHQGVFDLVFLRSIPNLVIIAPKDAKEFEQMLSFGVGLDRPVAIRYPKAFCPRNNITGSPLELGKAEVLREGNQAAIIALGTMVLPSLEAAKLLQTKGYSCSVINARFLKPLDTRLFSSIETQNIFTVEEGMAQGGFGSAVQEALGRPVFRIGLPDEFITHGKREILLGNYGLTASSIADKVLKVIQ